MVTVIINDCRDANAMARQVVRAVSLFGGQVVPTGVKNDLEAAGCLVDALDAIGGRKGLILVNVAPRHGHHGEKWPNVSPFGYFYYRNTLVLASVDGLTLSLAKKLNCLFEIRVLDSLLATQMMVDRGIIKKESELVKNSQFRSFDFLPYAAYGLLKGMALFSANFSVKDIVPAPPKAVWYIDCFGNAKTTLLPEDIKFLDNHAIETKIGSLRCYSHLNDVPDGSVGLVIGSSGIEGRRFLEVVAQGDSAAEKLGLEVGQVIL